MKQILAVDPGNEKSAYVLWDGSLSRFDKIPNDDLRRLIADGLGADVMVIEGIASYGMSVGAEVFETCVWTGRFLELFPRQTARMFRREVKLHLCGNVRAKDANIRQAILDRFGGKDKAIGKKADPGPLYGVKADCWQALALALTYADQNGTKP